MGKEIWGRWDGKEKKRGNIVRKLGKVWGKENEKAKTKKAMWREAMGQP